jgi:hypothetical protein
MTDFTATGTDTTTGAATLTADTTATGTTRTSDTARLAADIAAQGTTTDPGRGLLAAGLNARSTETGRGAAHLYARVGAGSRTVSSGYAVLAPLLAGRRVPWVASVPAVPTRKTALADHRITITALPRAATGEIAPARRVKGKA